MKKAEGAISVASLSKKDTIYLIWYHRGLFWDLCLKLMQS